jgi:hypothetical protein
MKVALLTLEAGVHHTLATTAFLLALADGLEGIGIDVRAVGLTRSVGRWRPEALAPFDASAPWIGVNSPRFRDELAAARLGIIDSDGDRQPLDGEDVPEWYVELLLQRELEAFAGEDADLVLVLYPISYTLLRIASRITQRCGWKLIVQSCEAMSGPWIDPLTRDDYIREVANSSDGVWALSDYLAEYWISHGVAQDRVIVRPNVVRRDAFRDDSPPNSMSALYLGNLQHRLLDGDLGVCQLPGAGLSPRNLW